MKNYANEKINIPILLKPAFKDYIWGGRRLKDDFSKETSMSPLAESWECSTHPAGESVAVGGCFDGMKLRDILEANPSFFGVREHEGGELPILVKLIDAENDLSVQVHPDDDYAGENENGQRGKTEMWYIIDAREDSSLIYGLKEKITKEQLKESAVSGSMEKYLQRVPISKNDVFYIAAGTIHAIGGGAIIAEVQESSDLTYRLYDYDRTDKNGNKRPLHIDKAADVADLNVAGSPRQPMRVLKYSMGMARELLGRCRYFEVYRMLINTERCKSMACYEANPHTYRVLLCIDGCGSISCDGESINFFKGDCFFIPATVPACHLHGKAQLLDIIG